MKELGIIAVYLFGSEAEGTAAWLDTYLVLTQLPQF